MTASAQDAQSAAAEAAKAITEAPEVAQEVVKPKYWTNSLKTNVNVGQTSLTNWAAGGDNTVSFAGFIDGNANYARNEMFWNNRLQLDYGFLYASSKPLLQKSTDRIYLESKWGYKAYKDVLFFSANYDFKSQFSTGYDYNTPATPDGYETLEEIEDKGLLKNLWKDARVLKSGFLAPAYTNLALGIDYKPTKWLSVNFAPLTGGYVIVRDSDLRKSYSMNLKKSTTDEALAAAEKVLEDAKATGVKADIEKATAALGNLYQAARFEFGAQLKVDAAVNVNDNFKYTTQVVLFYNYLAAQNASKGIAGGKCPRINWDNRIDWKLAKYFSLTLTTNLIYDDTIMITNPKDIDKFPEGKARVQFKESLAFGFTYTIASKK